MFNVRQFYSIPQFLRTAILRSRCRILAEKYKHLQRKVDQWLVFAVIRQKISSFRLNIVNEKLT